MCVAINIPIFKNPPLEGREAKCPYQEGSAVYKADILKAINNPFNFNTFNKETLLIISFSDGI
jgi:hypothetical protein